MAEKKDALQAIEEFSRKVLSKSTSLSLSDEDRIKKGLKELCDILQKVDAEINRLNIWHARVKKVQHINSTIVAPLLTLSAILYFFIDSKLVDVVVLVLVLVVGVLFFVTESMYPIFRILFFIIGAVIIFHVAQGYPSVSDFFSKTGDYFTVMGFIFSLFVFGRKKRRPSP
ncbi:hypothetical protein [Oceanidesulfovibrio marinus]|uniref:Uncharacterized protein n=1 Tax=Oceanidesulfovibrio marinus TaxID=370038 RepID=A0ABX6NI20_9BACT|nr:hypothetical protein [Oceanidesulfovibrio marinus]QJT09350.1 hypothetical protein E8L03_10540 [Oceanidesulfovibrio marinus]